MTSSEQKVQDWFISETHLLSHGRLKLFPETSVFCRLTEGKHKRIWKYVVDHVRSRCTAEKVRRILTVKEYHNELESPYAFADTNHHLQRIAKAKEKRSFLEGSLSELKKEIECAESEVQRLSDEICTINQKSAILDIITTEYRQKTADMNSLKSMLSFHFNRNTKHNSEFYLSLNIPNATKTVSSNKLKFRDGTECDQVKYVLRQITSHLVDSKSCDISESFKDNLKKRVDHMIKTYSLADIFVTLKELSNNSYMEFMAKETYSTSSQVQSLQIAVPNSSKHLKDMKLDFIQSSFNLRKTNREIEKLQEVQKLLLKKFMQKTDNAVFEKKFQLFVKVAENESLCESIKFLENALKVERDELEFLKNDVDKESNCNNLVLVIRTFYANFDKLCLLLNSGPNLHKSILKSLLNLYNFVNMQVFYNNTCTVKEYPFRIQQELKFDIQTMWSVLEKNNILKPLVPCLLNVDIEPDMLAKMLGVSKFESECIIGYKIKNLKEKVMNSQDKEFKFDEDVASQAHQKYILMTKTLQTMQQKLELCCRNFMEISEQSKRTESVLEDWWKQGAQFIPQIDHEGKSLKMWLDILLVLPDLLITDV
ncbi:hypothetical protein JTE90_002236 [Oedothorax gibbosus]|uniref:HAUS augmin-like complex subunit 3 N-terminal domain-containing protein n=1 Tax=Oedothorax gibbosus TaxID=931172 RepID=A0AAV6V649_9ARAC|nr:hypothetical protein JTE90_002236 [Oedothorax gibbosus]